MIKSKNNTFAFWSLLSICVLYTGLTVLGALKLLFGFGILLRNGENMNELKSDIFLFLGLACFMVIIFAALVKNIEIDPDAETISFQNRFTRQRRNYSFSEFDGYIETAIPHDNLKPYNAIGLVKDKRVIRIIDNYYYSNFEELKSGVNEMVYIWANSGSFFSKG